jgi:hypothetical protein
MTSLDDSGAVTISDYESGDAIPCEIPPEELDNCWRVAGRALRRESEGRFVQAVEMVESAVAELSGPWEPPDLSTFPDSSSSS